MTFYEIHRDMEAARSVETLLQVVADSKQVFDGISGDHVRLRTAFLSHLTRLGVKFSRVIDAIVSDETL